jgi:hypothetical protein
MQGTPTLPDVKAWLGLDPDDDTDDVVLSESLAAALAAQGNVCEYPVDVDTGEGFFTDDLVEAIYLRTQRLASRRNSPEGVIGISGVGGEFVGARVPTGDPDILRLEGPFLTMVVS